MPCYAADAAAAICLPPHAPCRRYLRTLLSLRCRQLILFFRYYDAIDGATYFDAMPLLPMPLLRHVALAPPEQDVAMLPLSYRLTPRLSRRHTPNDFRRAMPRHAYAIISLTPRSRRLLPPPLMLLRAIAATPLASDAVVISLPPP